MNALQICDVRAAMPNYDRYRDHQRDGAVTGIAVHHSATANPVTGLSMDDAQSVFRYHVETLGWTHGGYHYLVRPNGLVEYALDERIPAFHAGFVDPEDHFNLECGQFWNNHLLAVCLLGWFDRDRVRKNVTIPNRFTAPTRPQWRALVDLVRDLSRRYRIPPNEIKAHRELAGCRTTCPGANFDIEALRMSARGPVEAMEIDV